MVLARLALVTCIYALGGSFVRADGCPNTPTVKDTPLIPFNNGLRVVDFRHYSNNFSVVFGLADYDGFQEYNHGKLIRSESWGGSNQWSDLTQQLYDALPASIKSSVTLYSMGIEDIISFRFSSRLFVLGSGPYYWITDDHGVTFTGYSMPGLTQGMFAEVKPHPFNPSLLLMMVARKECESYLAIMTKWCAFDLFLSEQGGASASWKNLTQKWDNVYSFWDYEWATAVESWWGTPRTDALTNDKSILATVYQSAADMHGVLHGWDRNIHFVRGYPDQRSASRNVACGNQFESADGKVFVAVTTDCPVDPVTGRSTHASQSASPRVRLFVSEDRGQKFTQACIPTALEDRTYIVRQRYGPHGKYTGVFLLIDHDDTSPTDVLLPMANAYLSSNAVGEIFTLSLGRILKTSYATNLMPQDGLMGTHIANIIDPAFGTSVAIQDPDKALDYQQTLISFDDGTTWQGIPAPTTYTYPKCKLCDPGPNCRLHLHGDTSWTDDVLGRPAVYSHWNNPGVLMASGNTGLRLQRSVSSTCTWLSRDGGVTWEDVADEPYIFDYADQGSTIIMGRHYSAGPASELKISMNKGQCWQSIPLDEALDLENLRSDPFLSSDVVLAHGTRCSKTPQTDECKDVNNTDYSGLVYAIKIPDVLPGIATCGDGQRLKWAQGSDGCKFGMKFTIEIARDDAVCINTPQYNRKFEWGEPCSCSIRDMECEYGYLRSTGPNTCVPMSVPGGPQIARCPAIESREYVPSTSHLRLKDSDQCAGVVQFIKDTDGKGNAFGGNRRKGHGGFWAFFFISLALGGGGYYLWTKLDQYTKDSIVRSIGHGWDRFVGTVRGQVDRANEYLLGGATRSGPRSDDREFFVPLSDGQGLGGLDPRDLRGPREV